MPGHEKHEIKEQQSEVQQSRTHKARRDGRGCLGWSAVIRDRARISGSVGSENASGPCSAYFLSLRTQTTKKRDIWHCIEIQNDAVIIHT